MLVHLIFSLLTKALLTSVTRCANNLETAGVRLSEAPVENPGKIGVVKGYHAPPHAAYNKIKANMPPDTRDAERLNMTLSSMNATVGPEELCLILLVFSVIPRPTRSVPSSSQI